MSSWILPLIAVFSGFYDHTAWALTVEEAYRQIPHQRTVFDPAQAQMDTATRGYLRSAFELIDQGVVCRVEGIKSKTSNEEACYSGVLAPLASLKPPAVLVRFHGLVVEAVRTQRRAFAERAKSESLILPITHLRDSSQKLHEAYAELMKVFPKEAQHNKQAFFDHLCALDFL
jgi:hypothetical protein